MAICDPAVGTSDVSVLRLDTCKAQKISENSNVSKYECRKWDINIISSNCLVRFL